MNLKKNQSVFTMAMERMLDFARDKFNEDFENIKSLISQGLKDQGFDIERVRIILKQVNDMDEENMTQTFKIGYFYYHDSLVLPNSQVENITFIYQDFYEDGVYFKIKRGDPSTILSNIVFNEEHKTWTIKDFAGCFVRRIKDAYTNRIAELHSKHNYNIN